MDEHSELLDRLNQIEQQLSDLHNRVAAIESQNTNTKPISKKTKRKLLLILLIPILFICLTAGGLMAFRAFHQTTTNVPSFKDAEIGDTITFGRYEQDNSEVDGHEPIDWIVLDKKDGMLLLLSKYILFNGNSSGQLWSINGLRDYLNSDFVSLAFLPDEQSSICESVIGTANKTKDRIFMLSEEEVNHYFPTEESRKCSFLSSDNDSHSWWLRSTNYLNNESKNQQAYVSNYGKVDYITFSYLYEIEKGVRPAMWLDTTK